MQNNSQGHHDRSHPKAEPNSRGLRAKCHLVDDAASAEVTKTFVSGVVTDCLKLNVRKNPSADAEVLAIVDALSNVMVDMDASTDAFYKVYTETGVQGYCMKKYIDIFQEK